MNKQKILVLVESPTKARKIGEYLGEDYLVKATMGHIADLAQGGEYNLGIDLKNDFKLTYSLLPDKVSLLNELMEDAENAEAILLCPDNDREGCAIAMHLYSRLSKSGKPFKRVVFNEITKKSILNAISKGTDILSDENQNIYNAQSARRALDRIVGFMASPFLMNFFGPRLSAGRVQSVVAQMIVDREQEIEEFIPETYFTLKANLTKDKKSSFFARVEEKVIEEKRAKEIKAALLQSDFQVIKVESSEEIKKTPPPLITSQLQKILSKSYGMKPERAMQLAQQLYEQGMISYIRTDSVRTDPDAINEARIYLMEQGFTIPTLAVIHKTKDAAQDAHECIRPTDLYLTDTSPELLGEMKTVYGVIYRTFLASQMSPAIYDTLKITIKAGDIILKASGKALKSKGFLEILGIEDNNKIDIPALSEGDVLFLKGKALVSLEKKQTQPPPRFTNFSLIEMLEKKQIGRPATYADVLSKITGRNYVSMEGNTYHPTELGKKITAALKKSFAFMDYNYTAELEKKLDQIETGKQDYVSMLTSFFNPFKQELASAYKLNGAEICPFCSSPLIQRNGKEGKFWGCSSFPSCRFTQSITVSQVEASLSI